MKQISNNNELEKTKYEIPPILKKILSSDQWHKTIIETMLDGLIATDMNHNIIFVNTLLSKMLRYEKDELLGISSFSIVVDEDRNKVLRETEKRYTEKRTSQYEVSLKSKFGLKIPVLINATPILDDNGVTIGTYALVTDISDRKLVERELRNKNTELQTLYNNLLGLYQQLGSIIAETTKIHTEILLFTSKDCVYCAPAEEVLQEVLTAYGGKITYRKVDIEKEPELAAKFDILSLPTIVIGNEQLTSVPDIYRLHSALFSALVPSEKFRRTRQELDNIINYSPIAIFTLNSEGIITGVNPIVAYMLKMDKDEIIGQNVNSIQKNAENTIFSESLTNLFKRGFNGEKIFIDRLKIRNIQLEKPEPFTIISLKVVPMANKEGLVTEILILIEDVTLIAINEEKLAKSYKKLEELNDKLLQMNKERSAFVELTTTGLLEPLRNSKELTEQILSGQLGELNEEAFGTLEYLRNNFDNVTKSITSILDYAALETKGFNLKLKRYTIKELISETLKALGSIVIDKGFIVLLNVPNNLSAWCDKEQVIRIFKNLILNAIKFTDKDCNINISANKTNNGFIEINVKDNGRGIEEKDLERIFEQFMKIDATTQGSGLGLTVVKSLVEAHGGSVKAFSEGLNKGSTFKFTLPMTKANYQKAIDGQEILK